jgi:hypothetical protein
MWLSARRPWPVMSIVYDRSKLKRGASSGCTSPSKTVVRMPRRASAIATTSPAGPPPTMAIPPALLSVMTPPSVELACGRLSGRMS